MIEKINISSTDIYTLKSIDYNKQEVKDDHTDYSKVVVKKPWGYEYIIFENEDVAVWILYLKPGAQTSMHCHPIKKTSLVVLSGEVICSTLVDNYIRGIGDGLLIEKGVFHQTKTNSSSGAYVMEIESPVNKRDLVRLKDQYGREGKGYERADRHSLNLQNYNYISFGNFDIPYNFKKHFGRCSLSFKKLSNYDEIKHLSDLADSDVISILKGEIINSNGKRLAEIGDTFQANILRNLNGISINPKTEVLIIRKIDTLTKISDFVASFLSDYGVKDIFLIPGDANVHLLDSIGKSEALSFYCTQSESSASMAAEAYGKISNQLPILIISSGSSGPNALVGVARAWIDSIPMLIISGQARTDQESDGRVRQLGNKSLNIIDIVNPITKYAVKITDSSDIKYQLEKSVYLAQSGRPGPVWIDLPIDIQGTTIDKKDLLSFDIPTNENEKDIDIPYASIINLLKSAKRPVLVAGNGIRLAGAEKQFLALVRRLGIPVLTSRRGADLISENDELFYGRPGVYGQRRANFVIQNADFLLTLGTRLSIPLIGRNVKAFARSAKKVIVDIDQAELEKKTIKPDIAVCQSVDIFIDKLIKSINSNEKFGNQSWLDKCDKFAKEFPLGVEYSHKGKINPYLFIQQFSNILKPKDIIVYDGGSIMNYVMQTFEVKENQRLISSTGIELAGFSLSGAIGVSIQKNGGTVYCLCEDQGLQLSIQELHTIKVYQLPIKIINFWSKGNATIRKIQKDFFASRFVGTDQEMLLGRPNLLNISEQYGIATLEISKVEEIHEKVNQLIEFQGPCVCEVQVDTDQELIPRMGFSIHEDGKWLAKPLEESYPFIKKDKLKTLMDIELWEED